MDNTINDLRDNQYGRYDQGSNHQQAEFIIHHLKGFKSVEDFEKLLKLYPFRFIKRIAT